MASRRLEKLKKEMSENAPKISLEESWSGDKREKIKKVREGKLVTKDLSLSAGPMRISLLETWTQEEMLGVDWADMSVSDVQRLIQENPLDLDRLIFYSTLCLIRYEYMRLKAVSGRKNRSKQLDQYLKSLDEMITKGMNFHRLLLTEKRKQDRAEEIHIELIQPLLDKVVLVIRKYVRDPEVLQRIGESIMQIYSSPAQLEGLP